MNLYGFTLLRNGVKYDYPFRESLQSLSYLTEEIVLAFGNSQDTTEKNLKDFPKLNIIPTIWDENKRVGGQILSEQTNIALHALEKKHKNGWGLYLQADEVFSDFEKTKLLQDLAVAEKEGYDAISFRYLHFWQAYDKIAVTKRWYPQEIRAIRLNAGIESYGDAQSFKGCKKVFLSDCHVFHYGHVREAAAYEAKKNDFHRWWHPNDTVIQQVIARGKKREETEEILRYLGPHPSFMQERIAAPTQREKILFFGEKNFLPDEFYKKILVNQLEWSTNTKDLARFAANEIVPLTTPSLVQGLLSQGKLKSKVPAKMRSPQARAWTKEFVGMLRLSEKGFSLKA